ncbi:hypothetical protein Pav037_4088 [Pseudomonas syringae pv. avellanae str. ISPaVe037]|nr:hypothetical protein Pav037_4088 [Pseudomonas syringae pv. avellanae str. ISPaVe037]
MMSEGFVLRPAVTVPRGEGWSEFSHPELLQIQLSKQVLTKPLDIGCLAYKKRSGENKSKNLAGTPVVLASLDVNRRDLIIGLLEAFVGLGDQAMLTRFRHLTYFFDWVDAQDSLCILGGPSYAQQIYREFTDYLRAKIAQGAIKPITASSYQVSAIIVFGILYPSVSSHIVAGAYRIIGVKESLAPRESLVLNYQKALSEIAAGCASIILHNKPYPTSFAVAGRDVTIFAARAGIIGPFAKCPPVFNLAEKRVSTFEEYLGASNKEKFSPAEVFQIKAHIASANRQCVEANSEPRHWLRIKIAIISLKAYAGLLLLITGASPTEFSQFSYEDALGVVKSPLKKELSAVKFRAAGKATLYNLGRGSGVEVLRDYLKIRAWILGGKQFDQLFFLVSTDRTSLKPFPTSGVMAKFHNAISGLFIDPVASMPTPREMRKLKSNVLHRKKFSPSVIADVLNHTEQVNLSTYSEASPEQQGEELRKYWEAVRHAANKILSKQESASVQIAVPTIAGHCSEFNSPIILDSNSASLIKSACNTGFGCVFCENYVFHAEESDLHKLLSMQYVVNKIRGVAADSEHAELTYKNLSVRVEYIIATLAGRSESMQRLVDDVKRTVNEYGILTAFWERRLSNYEYIGVIS